MINLRKIRKKCRYNQQFFYAINFLELFFSKNIVCHMSSKNASLFFENILQSFVYNVM